MTRCEVLERIGDVVAMRKGANCFLSPFLQNKNTLPKSYDFYKRFANKKKISICISSQAAHLRRIVSLRRGLCSERRFFLSSSQSNAPSKPSFGTLAASQRHNSSFYA